jgi:hypothetical protein
MTTLIKFIIGLLGALLMSSCSLNLSFGQINGNGNVQTENFNISQDFDRVAAGNGWDVILEKGDAYAVIVEADENLIDAADIYVKNGTLKIYCEDNIRKASSKKVYVTYVDQLDRISASSGAYITSKQVLEGEQLDLDVSSGGSIKTTAVVRSIDTDVSSGGSINIAGSTETLAADASSGGTLKAKELKAKFANAQASSGGAIDIMVTNKLTARASSGGDIDYWGSPKEVDKPKRSVSGGSVDAKE